MKYTNLKDVINAIHEWEETYNDDPAILTGPDVVMGLSPLLTTPIVINKYGEANLTLCEKNVYVLNSIHDEIFVGDEMKIKSFVLQEMGYTVNYNV